MKDEQKQTNTYTPTSIIESQWGADEAAELLGWDSDDDSDEEDYSDDYGEEDRALCPECYYD